MVTITSVNHEAIKRIVRMHTTAGRKKENLFLVEGFVFIESFKKNGYHLVALYSTESAYKKYPITTGHVQFVSDLVMSKISQATTPSGYIAIFQKPSTFNFSKLSSGLVLAQISDPGNMGTLIRSAAAFGYKTVVVVEGCDVFSYKVIQSTAGTLPLVNLIICSWSELRNNTKKLQLVALVTEGGKNPSDYNSQTTLFVVGNEAHGLPVEWVQSCDELCTLPMQASVESLNAAVAGSLVLALAYKK